MAWKNNCANVSNVALIYDINMNRALIIYRGKWYFFTRRRIVDINTEHQTVFSFSSIVLLLFCMFLVLYLKLQQLAFFKK